MNHSTIDNLDEIMDVLKQYNKIFPHIRSDKIQRMIESENVVWEEKVLITYNHYQRKQKVGTYEAQKGDCILHQIAAKNQGDGSGKRVFENFLHFNRGRDVVLSVRSENDRAISFYKKYGFIKVSDITWGKESQVKGEVYLLEQKPLYRFRDTHIEEIISYSRTTN